MSSSSGSRGVGSSQPKHTCDLSRKCRISTPPQLPAPGERAGGWRCDGLYFNPGKKPGDRLETNPEDHPIRPVGRGCVGYR